MDHQDQTHGSPEPGESGASRSARTAHPGAGRERRLAGVRATGPGRRERRSSCCCLDGQTAAREAAERRKPSAAKPRGRNDVVPRGAPRRLGGERRRPKPGCLPDHLGRRGDGRTETLGRVAAGRCRRNPDGIARDDDLRGAGHFGRAVHTGDVRRQHPHAHPRHGREQHQRRDQADGKGVEAAGSADHQLPNIRPTSIKIRGASTFYGDVTSLTRPRYPRRSGQGDTGLGRGTQLQLVAGRGRDVAEWRRPGFRQRLPAGVFLDLEFTF